MRAESAEGDCNEGGDGAGGKEKPFHNLRVLAR
jgi:hypothetical protein